MFLSECCTFCTILHITFLSLERYLAVCWPITAKTLLTRRRTRVLIGCLWLGAAVSAAPVLLMVGVEDVGGEELGSREDGGWTSKEGEQRGIMVGAGERGHGHNGGLEEMEWGERIGELKWFGEEGESKAGSEERGERNQGDGGKKEFENQPDDGGGEEEGEMGVEGERQNKMKEDEGGGREEGVIDNRECRCTQFAVSSGLLSAMMVVSNLYFLVPFGILGLVYSLIGRTLCLRPPSSRRDQSHRHTVKMLGVIVLAFVLCWLPFHVARTIFFFQMDSIYDGQEGHTDTDLDTDARADVNALAHVAADADIDAPAKRINRSDSDAHLQAKKTTARAHAERGAVLCDAAAKTNHTRGDRPSGSHVRTLGQNGTHARIRSQNNTRHHAPSTRRVTPTGPYGGGALNDTRFNATHPQPDYFLYYLSQYFNLVSSALFYLSAAVNPLLYNLMSGKYRHAVRSLVHTQSRRLRTLTTRHSTTTL